MTTAPDTIDIDTILGDPKSVTLASGSKVNVQRLKTRQLLRLLRVLTRGVGPALTEFNFGGEQSGLTQQILGMVLMSIPEAEDETVDFILSMVTPEGFNESPKSDADRKKNEDLFHAMAKELDNPELDDLITIMEVVIQAETPHIVALGKRLATLLTAHQKSETAKKSAKKNS